jgi:hypothetical protein
MGTVYIARDPAIDRLVSQLTAQELDNPELLVFHRSAIRRAAAPSNIITIFHVGEHDTRYVMG